MKSKLVLFLSLSFLLMISVFSLTSPKEVESKEKELHTLSSKMQDLITESTEEKRKAYLFLPKETTLDSNHIYFYFDRNDKKHLYSYPAADIFMKNDSLQIDLIDQDAIQDSEAKDTLLLEFQLSSLPQQMEIFYNNRKLEIEMITY